MENEYSARIAAADISAELKAALESYLRIFAGLKASLPRLLQHRIDRGIGQLVAEAVDPTVETHWWETFLALAARELQLLGELGQPLIAAGQQLAPLMMAQLGPYTGVTLRDELRSRQRLDADRVIRIFRGVCDAAEAAHLRRLIHRDLKPENIFLACGGDTGGEVVKVLDFGIAKSLPGFEERAGAWDPAETDAGVVVGTPGYMSPEQLLGEEPDVSWDLWALAVTAYESLTGVLPFPATSREEWRRSVLRGQHVPLARHLPSPPAAWEEFFARSLAADRDTRPRSAADLLHGLEHALTPPPRVAE